MDRIAGQDRASHEARSRAIVERPRFLVTGATDFIGLEVAPQLSVAGRLPRLLDGGPHRGQLFSRLGVEGVEGDLMSPESLAEAVAGRDEVIQVDARASFERYESVRPTIVDGTLALFRAAQRAGVVALQGTRLLERAACLRRSPTLYTPDTARDSILNLPVEPGLLWRELGIRPIDGSMESDVPASLDDETAFRWRHPMRDTAAPRPA